MHDWTFITKHGLVLLCLSKQRQMTVREIASTLGTTEWTVHQIITALATAGYVKRQKLGRNNVYQINDNLKLRHDIVRHVDVSDLLKLLV